ncbi:MAG TPA: ABC transporter permease [Candidatus Lustribacter sp.]|nr:ABC transporter permease [Candidatus Lustribacter sp.]
MAHDDEEAPMSAGAPAHSAAEEFAARQHSSSQRIQHLLHAHPAISPALVLVVATAVFGLINPRFVQPGSLSLVLQQFAVVGLLAVGQTLVILTAGIDLSVGAITILAMMLMGSLSTKNHLAGFVALVIGWAFAAAAGAFNGALVTRLSLPPFIVTLGTLSIFTAVALLYSGGKSIDGSLMPDLLNVMGNGFGIGPFRFTVGVAVVLLVYALLGFVLSQTAWGRHVYATGDDIEAARLSGISVNRVLLSVYAVAGAIFGLAAWVQIGRAGAASPNGIVDANLESITAVVIGGTSLFGGRGALLGTLLGALIVRVFGSGLALAGVDSQWRVFAIGVLVIVAVSIDQWIRTVRA